MRTTSCDHEINVIAFSFYAILPEAIALSEERQDQFAPTTRSHNTGPDPRMETPPPKSA